MIKPPRIRVAELDSLSELEQQSEAPWVLVGSKEGR